MRIPFHKPYITDEELSEVLDTLKSGWLTMGPKTLKFEEEFKTYVGSKYAIAVNSCTAALHLALRAANLRENEEVIIPTMTFTATAQVVCYFGAKPVLVDIDRETCNIDLAEIEKAITPRTRFIIPVHFGGQPCDMDEIIYMARSKGLIVIEDAAHALPAIYRGRKIGTIGDITCFSFYSTKTLTTGDGGMITTEKREWAEKIRILRLHGISKDAWKRYSDEGSWYYEVTDLGYKYNMTDIQAALGIAQLKKVDYMWERRKEIARKYTDAFRNSKFIIPPLEKPDRVSAWHLYVIKLNLEAITIDRSRFIEELKRMGVGTSVHFIPLHRHPFYKNTFGYSLDDFPSAEWVYERCVSLPIYPQMSDWEIEFVIESVCNVCKRFER